MTMRTTRLGPWVALGLACLSAQAPGQEAAVLADDQDRLSYALGMDLGAQLRLVGVTLDPAIFARALADGLAGKETLMTPADAKIIIQLLQTQLQRRQAQAKAQAALPTDPGSAVGAEPADASPKPDAVAPPQRAPGAAQQAPSN